MPRSVDANLNGPMPSLAQVQSTPRRQPVVPVRLLYRDAVSSFGMTENVLMVVGREAPRKANAMLFTQALGDAALRHPKGFGLIVTIAESSTPDPNAREIMLAGFRRHWPVIRASVFVVEASGFQGSVQRSMISAATLLMGQRDRLKIVKQFADGADWFVERVPSLAQNDAFTAVSLAHSLRHFADAERSGGPLVVPVTFSG